MKRDEKICAALFLVALAGVFLRPLYDHFLPGLTPAYIFLIIGFLTFFITAAAIRISIHMGTGAERYDVGYDDSLCRRYGSGLSAERRGRK